MWGRAFACFLSCYYCAPLDRGALVADYLRREGEVVLWDFALWRAILDWEVEELALLGRLYDRSDLGVGEDFVEMEAYRGWIFPG